MCRRRHGGAVAQGRVAHAEQDETPTLVAKALPDGGERDWEADVALLARQLRQALLAQREGARIVGGSYAAKRHSLTLAKRLAGSCGGPVSTGSPHSGPRPPSSATPSARPWNNRA
ncbi:TetR/AcrR family transcriptional regulator C-terminal domain-containing protein [Streptomyces sp. NPDC058420]|uniref:TetR/AcrR family transcriptional regulator C-terminal domain-containing protein n=1 Tax=Streptomyces sp. NPDC058420 TaxID=3346489 RepID=UPI00365629B1